MSLVEDPNAEARSLMNRRPAVCDGEANGVPCKHFWPVIQRFQAANTDAVRSGDKRHSCTMAPSFLLEWTSEEKPTYCGRYEPRKAPGLRALVARAVAGALFLKPGEEPALRVAVGSHAFHLGLRGGYAKFDTEFGVFRPMTPEEIEANRKANPDRDIAWGSARFGQKNPTEWNASDIAGGEQINMVPRNADGTQTPLTGAALSAATEAALSGVLSAPVVTNPISTETKPDGLLTRPMPGDDQRAPGFTNDSQKD